MTGSLSKEYLQQAASTHAALFQSQPEAWWSKQAEGLRAQWLETGLPTTKLEAWKYTSLSPLNAKDRTIGLGLVDVVAPAGVRIVRLSEVAKTGADVSARVQELLQSNDGIFFENFAKSLVADPVIVIVPAKQRSEEPIRIAWPRLADGQWSVGVAAVIVGEGADVSIFERYGAGVDVQTSATFVSVGAHACVSHLRLQAGENQDGAGIVLSSVRTTVAEGGKYESSQVSFGSRLSREDLTVELLASEAETTVDGVFIGRSSQLLDHHTNLVHRVGATTSRQVYKGILSDESRGVFNGRIAIAKNASGANSGQMNKNLLLSRRVELDTKPQLEIDNDDVKAAHGAAIGRLDPEHIFYLRSRGISEGQAVEMLARGFAFEAVDRLSSKALRDAGRTEIERGLHGLTWESL